MFRGLAGGQGVRVDGGRLGGVFHHGEDTRLAIGNAEHGKQGLLGQLGFRGGFLGGLLAVNPLGIAAGLAVELDEGAHAVGNEEVAAFLLAGGAEEFQQVDLLEGEAVALLGHLVHEDAGGEAVGGQGVFHRYHEAGLVGLGRFDAQRAQRLLIVLLGIAAGLHVSVDFDALELVDGVLEDIQRLGIQCGVDFPHGGVFLSRILRRVQIVVPLDAPYLAGAESAGAADGVFEESLGKDLGRQQQGVFAAHGVGHPQGVALPADDEVLVVHAVGGGGHIQPAAVAVVVDQGYFGAQAGQRLVGHGVPLLRGGGVYPAACLIGDGEMGGGGVEPEGHPVVLHEYLAAFDRFPPAVVAGIVGGGVGKRGFLGAAGGERNADQQRRQRQGPCLFARHDDASFNRIGRTLRCRYPGRRTPRPAPR